MEPKFPRILKETADYLVVDKPAGWLSIPGRDPSESSVLAELRSKFSEVLPVHRIDRGTSGLLLFARTETFHRTANGWFESHTIKKSYLALAHGRSALPSFQVRSPIEGKRAITQVRVLEAFREAFLAEVEIATGKRHQIRIHLSEEGHPLLGDSQYGGLVEFAGLAFTRPALHAARLVFPTGEKFESELPEDFSNWILALRRESA